MNSSFWAIALSRQEGSPADGIHLLWTAPPAAGYSVKGYDIQRRRSRPRRAITCYTLTEDELRCLHQELRVQTPLGRVGVRLADCPTFPQEPPDEPFEETPPPSQRCINFQAMPPGEGLNPRIEDRLTFMVQGYQGEVWRQTEIVQWGQWIGLNCSFQTEIRFPVSVSVVELTLVHFAQPGRIAAYNADNTRADAAGMSQAGGEPETIRLTGEAIHRIIIDAPQNELLLLKCCYDVSQQSAAEVLEPARLEQRSTFSHLFSDSGAGALFASPFSGTVAPMMAAAVNRPVICLAYQIDLNEPHYIVRIQIGVPAVLAIALYEGKAVESYLLTQTGGLQHVQFSLRRVDQVQLYVAQTTSQLIICVDVPSDPRKEDQEWRDEPYIAQGIQLPVRAVNGDLASTADEESLAFSRLLADESADSGMFREVADLMNQVAQESDRTSPVWRTTQTRNQADDPFVELRGWAYTLALLTDPAWRRMLGFGYFDDGRGLDPGTAYDYRITGYFRRRDLEEQLLGFHTIPSGTTLPAAFHLDAVLVNTFEPSPVELFPPTAATAMRGTGRKGIAFRRRALGESFTLTLPTAVTRLVLECEPSVTSGLEYWAKTSDFFLGLSGTVFSGALPSMQRLELTFPEPVDTVSFRGEGFLYGIRVVASPLGVDPEEVVRRSLILYHIRYEPTPPPPPPPFLGTMNLQQPMLPGNPAVTVQNPPNSMGFQLRWLPPPSVGVSVLWPTDLGAFPPFDVLGFHLERRRVDTGGGFEEIDQQKPHTLFFGNRSDRREVPPLTFGADVLALFPEVAKPQPPVSVLMDADDVLISAAQTKAPPGSLHQYQIFSVDAIGRRSAVATLGSVVRLEKRLPPPQPTEPTLPPPAGAVLPAGVRARVLQAADRELAVSDRTLLGSSTNAVVLEWAWTDQERTRDPYATEFRIYWQPVPPDTVEGTLSGPATLVSSLYEMTATLNQPVAENAMQGRYIRAGSYPFKVASHPAGQVITLRLEPSLLDSSRVPEAASFEFHPVLDGRELRPSAWAERSAVVPITSTENYRYVFRDRLILDGDHPRVRLWVGVSAADSQSYIADELPAIQPNGGRPGNESSIAAVPAQARYRGRPEFTVPPPLPDVPEVVTDEPTGAAIALRLDLPALFSTVTIPAGYQVVLERVGIDALVALISARPDNTIGVNLPDGTSSSYVLPNPVDQATFLAAIRSSTPARVEGRFLMEFLTRYRTQLESLWQPALPRPISVASVVDTLPNKAERYIHRIRLVDGAGHISAGAAIAPQIVRVPSLRSPAPPDLTLADSDDDTLPVVLRVHDAFDLKWVLLFNRAVPLHDPIDANTLDKAQLLRLPNRRDLYPYHGIRLRLPDGTLLEPTPVEVATGIPAAPDRLINVSLTPGFDQRVALWAIALTRDGIPSRFTGPRLASTGPTPLQAPILTVTATSTDDQATWTALSVPAEVAVERSTDGTTWQQVSPWLPPTQLTHPVSRLTPPLPRQYRLQLRAPRTRLTTSPVTLS